MDADHTAGAHPDGTHIPLSALLSHPHLGLRHLAGPRSPDPAVYSAHASEMADPYPYLLGGELLLTAGAHIPHGAPRAHFDTYVSRIVAAGGAALGFGVAPVHDTVPPALVAACAEQGLPLLEVPPRTTFSGVARAVWQLAARARHAELRRVAEAQQGLAAAASRPDPVPAVLARLARHVSGYAVLHAPDGTPAAEAGREPAPGVRAALTALTAVVRPTEHRTAPPASATDTAPTADPATPTAAHAVTHLTAYALGPGGAHVLGLAAPRRDPGDHTVASAAAVLLSLLTAGGTAQDTGTADRTAALVRLLVGAPPEDVVPLLGAAGARWRVVHAEPVVHARPADREQDSPATPSPAAPSPATPSPATPSPAALASALGTPLLDPVGPDLVRLLLPAKPTDPTDPDSTAPPTPPPGWTLGISAPASAATLPAADAQAARALARARATRVPLVRHGERAGFADLVPPEEARAHARALLAPLAERPALTETLRVWLSLHGSWDRTAVALGVHRNTVRQRIARCATLLDTDPDDPDVRMELWFALREE